jgi:Peptidase family M1 domain/Carboxypeptidase regulatory-like domain
MRSLFSIATLLIIAIAAQAAKLEGVVKDASGAVIAGASVQAKGPSALQTTTDDHGHFQFDPVDAGSWTITVEHAGFAPATASITLAAADARELNFELKIAEVQTEVEVAGKRSSLANSDPNYVALRNALPSEAWHTENIQLTRDLATITLRTGQIVFLPPVLNRICAAVFVGDGRLQLKAALEIESANIRKITGNPEIDEEFTSAILYFTDATADEIKKQSRTMEINTAAANALKDFRSRVRHQPEHPRSMIESLLTGADTVNIEADMLGELYNPAQGPSFRAYIHGKKLGDLRFLDIPQGAMPQLPSPEEIGLISFDPVGEHDAILYLSHRLEEWKQDKANNAENKRTVVAQHYRIETAIGRNNHLASIADVHFSDAVDGARVIHFGLLPALRVTRVMLDNHEIPYIQEARREDGSFYVIMPQPMNKDAAYQLRIEYEGDHVISSEGAGNFSVDARESWYPVLNAFLDRATYDLVFKVPKAYTVVSVGRQVSDNKEGDSAVTEWVSDIPLAVAGFNYGYFKKKQVVDSVTKYTVESYATSEVPDYLHNAAEHQNLTPAALADRAIVDGQNSIRLFEHWFGDCPYGRIAITQQPSWQYGQSWPSLVYLPLFAFFDATQRYLLMGSNEFRYHNFIEEVTPHEISHQWWGHMVGWASYRDQWLSEGFAEFSAGLFVEQTEKKEELDHFWKRLQEEITNKNQYGISANEAGPLWMGLRLDSYRSPGAYNRLVYPKGAYILQMLRMLMREDKTGDEDFITMMKDYVQTHLHRNATTESFANVVDKHMKPVLDMQGNHRIDWFFRDWIYSTEMPRYKLEYSFSNQGGKTQFTGKLTQSDVSQNFMMRVPIYFEIDGKIIRAGYIAMHGSTTSNEVKITLPKKPKRVLIAPFHDVLASEISIKEV